MSAERDSKETVVKEAPAQSRSPEYPRPEHPWKPGPLISVPDKVIKSSVGGIVRALPSFENGWAFLDFRNETDTKIEIQHAFYMVTRGWNLSGLQWAPGGNGARLLGRSVVLNSLESHKENVTVALGEALRAENAPENGTFRFQIKLVLDPDPPSQPGPGKYKVVLTNGSIQDFSADLGE